MPIHIDRLLTLPSSAQTLMTACTRLINEGHDVVKLFLGQPGTGAPAKALDVLQDILKKEVFGYTSSLGLQSLRDRIAQDYSEKQGVTVSPDRVVVTIGASMALLAILMICFKSGHKIGLPYPCYPGQANTITGLNMSPVGILTSKENDFQLTVTDLEAMDEKIDGLLITTPSNPTGAIIEADELEKIIAYCDANDITLMVDEIYQQVVYPGSPKSTTALTFSDDLIVINSFSKYYSMPGWRLGWMVVPEAMSEIVANDMRNFILSPCAASQHLALATMNCPDELQGYVDQYQKNRDLLCAGLEQAGFTEYCKPNGAFYIYFNIAHTGMKDAEFAMHWLQEKHIAVMPGSAFDPVRGQDYIRLSYAGTQSDIEKVVDRIT